MADYLPAKFLQPGRDQIAADWRRDYQLRNPGADVGPNSQPMLESLTMADSVTPLYTYADRIAKSTSWQTATGDDLRSWAQRMGTDFLPATGAIGFVQIQASAGGTYIQAGDQLTVNGMVYKAIAGGLYQDGAQVGVVGVTTGPQTNQRPGTVLQWTTPRPGLGPNATVVLQPDGSGLFGGSLVESEASLKQRLAYLKANPPASGNDAHYQSIIWKTPGVAVQQAFTYPGCMGPGTTGVTFTVRPSISGASRIPSAAQLTLALGYLIAAMPATDGIFMCALVSSAVDMVLKTVWATGAAGWADASPFPLYQSPGNNWVITSAIPATPTSFNIKSATDATVPQAGQSIGVLDLVHQVFQRKKILTATANAGGYNITVDTSNGSSDATYTPVTGQLICPWSDSLQALIAPVLAYFDSIGPGEQFANFFDPGLRQRRSPASPGLWSSSIAARMIGGPPNASQPPDPNAAPTPTLLSTPAVGDVELVEPTPPYATPAGNPGVSAYLLALNSLGAFPE